MMKQNVTKEHKIIVLLLTIVLIVITMGLMTKEVKAASEPYLSSENQGVVFMHDDFSDQSALELKNLPQNVDSIKWEVENKAITTLNDFEEIAYFSPKKPGTTKVTATVEAEGKTYIATKSVTVKYANGITGVNIGSNAARASQFKIEQKEDPYFYLLRNTNGKLKISTRKGWTVASVSYFNGGALKKIKNGSTVNITKNCTDLRITMQETATKAMYTAIVHVDKYDTWRIIYGSMKSVKGSTTNLAVLEPPVFEGDSSVRYCYYKYDKKATASQAYRFKSYQDLTKKLNLKMWHRASYGNKVIVLRAPKTVKVKWISPGKNCKIVRQNIG